MKSLTFNGKRKTWVYLLEGRQKAPFAPRNNNLLRVPGMPGAYYKDENIDVLYITQPVGFIVENDADALAKQDELAEWLITGKVVELQFDDEPGRTYFAKLEGTIDDYQKFIDQRRGMLTFLCPDPYAYGQENPFVASSDNFKITNLGTAEAEPIFEFEVLAPITFLMIQNQFGEWNMIGKPTSLEDVTVEPYTTILHDTCDSTSGWVEGNDLIDGSKAGSVFSQDGKIRANNYGTGTSWHGPVVKKSLSQPVQDFNLQVLIDFNEAIPDNTGRLQVSVLDVNNSVIGMVSFFDIYPNYFDKVGRGQIGTDLIVSDRGVDWSGYFVGRLVLQRKGDKITAKISQYDTYRKIFIDSVEGLYTDYLNQHQTPITQVQLHFGAYGEHTRPFMSVNDVHLRKINNTSNAIPYLAMPGDKVIFDHTNNGQIYINGEPYEDSILGADYFTLKKGENNLFVAPTESVNTTGSYRNRYL